uniref:Uncharacterized protein n=1 Tax=Caenorhabditis japonica TaxID=281687 RepID=A0A8R1DI79_CAEJA
MERKNAAAKSEEAGSAHVELNRLYEIAKEKIEAVRLGSSSIDSKQLANHVKEAQRLLRSMQAKNNSLKSLAKEIPVLSERKEVEVNVQSHEKQINLLQRKLKEASDDVGKEIAAEDRRALLLTKDGKLATGSVKVAAHEERANRLQDLVAKMSRQVDSGEQAMSSLVHSSSVLGHTQNEYDNQKGHISLGKFGV